ncbi:MAG: Gfo/Idh/MocA family oxidoreductase [Planctomycetota bacterium]|nr:Gfo/Idh/MocA family oxidoreductase [Planctomycetota bacterium]MDA1250068.1 Gfo/Idh/MocA family oxidoreductase [Planctomycetota bacterium]
MTESDPLDLEYRPRMPQRKDVSIGCIGSGFIMADCHLVAYRQAGFNPVAIASRNFDNAKAVADRHGLAKTYGDYRDLLDDAEIEVVDIAVPPDIQLEVVREAVQRNGHLRGILAQKPLGMNYAEAVEIVRLCEDAGITLAVNQNMRYDQSIRACRSLLDRGDLGEPVFASIDMRAIPHWMPWQERLGWVTLRIMSIHHLDSFRFLFGDPQRVFASIRSDPRTATKFPHEDGICLYILEYENGMRASSWDDVWTGPAMEGAEGDIGICWRVEGTEGLARGTIGWPSYPERTPSTLEFTSARHPGKWHQPTWDEVWFPDAFVGPMAQLLVALETASEPEIGGRDNLGTMALVEACYLSAKEHRAVEIAEISNSV